MKRRVVAALAAVGLGSLAAFAGSSSAVSPQGPKIRHGVRVAPAVFEGSVRRLPRPTRGARLFAAPRVEREGLEPQVVQKVLLPGASPAAEPAAPVASAPAPDPISSFKGLDHDTWGAGFPPDTNGDVGPSDFVEVVNTSVGIFRKSDGFQLAAFTFDDLWSGTGTACDDNNQGDPTVVYDPQGDRWIVADFAFTGNGDTPPFYECIAVSKTGDPVAGGWYLYPIRADDAGHPWFPDYPKMGIWPDGLYMTANMFSTNAFEEVRVWAFNRSDLESGATVRNVVVDLATPDYFSLLPATMHTAVGAPPAGRDELLASESTTAFAWEVWKFHADYAGSGSTFTLTPTNVSQTSYDFRPDDVPTPGNTVDSLFDRLMMQAQYTDIGGTESLWVNHTVHCCGMQNTPLGIQWAQINVTGGNVGTTPVQMQTYPSTNDGLNRWMGSLAVDRGGDMALGYSVANGSTNPDIRYAGRLAGDSLGTLPQTEKSLLAGVTRGSQIGSCGGGPCSRWGDYSAMSLDPDGCTFWYTQEYYETSGLNWQTRIGSFKFPSCTPRTSQTIAFVPLANKAFGDPDFTLAATATSGLPVSFAAGGSCTVAGSTVHLTGAGSCTITASQVGDATFGPAPDVSQTFSIAKGSQTIAFGALAPRAFGDADFALVATASSGLPVTFAASGACTVSGATVHLTAPGACTITASQGGDPNYNAAPDVAQSFSIAKTPQTIAFAALPGRTFGDPDFAVSASASSGLPVTFAATGSCTLSGANVHITAAGTCTVTASQAGDLTHAAAADVAQAFTVAKAGQAITFHPLPKKTLGAPDFTVAATASSGLPVSFAGRGACRVTGARVHLRAAGRCTVTASQPGTSDFNPAPDVVRRFVVVRPCTVPNVVGRGLAAARRALSRNHCRAGSVLRVFSGARKGAVVSQSRAAGRVLPPGASVGLVVSRGRRG